MKFNDYIPDFYLGFAMMLEMRFCQVLGRGQLLQEGTRRIHMSDSSWSIESVEKSTSVWSTITPNSHKLFETRCCVLFGMKLK